MSFPGITNHVVEISGSTVTAYLAVRDSSPDEWIYTLWEQDEEGEELVSYGDLNLSPMKPTPAQVARVAFLLDVEYATV